MAVRDRVHGRTRGALLAVVVAACLASVSASVKQIDIGDATSDTIITVLDRFGLEAGGKLQAQLTVQPDGQRVYLSMFPSSDWDSWQSMSQAQSAAYKIRLCTIPSTLRYEVTGTADIDAVVPFRDQYSVAILACQGSGVSVKGWIAATNPSAGSMRHFSLEYTRITTITICLLVAYGCLAVLWGLYCRANLADMRKIHWLCCVTIVLKVVDIAASLAYYSSFGDSGEHGTNLFVARQIITSVSDTVFLTVLLLIALGWALTRATLTRRELQVMFVMIAVFLFIGVIKSFCTDDDRLCAAYVLTEYVVRSLIMLGIIVAMNFNITHLRAAVHDGPWAPSLPAAYRHLRHFQQFRWAFLAYLLLPTMLLIVKITVLTWRFEWATEILREALVLFIFVHVGVTFRPVKVLTFADIANGNRAALEQSACPPSEDEAEVVSEFAPVNDTRRRPRTMDTFEIERTPAS